MPRVIETSSLFVLILVACLRPLVAETYDSAGSSITAALSGVADPSPLRTLVFDLLVLSSACGWLLARAIGPARRRRSTGLGWGAAIITIAAVISCLAAGNKRLAVNASIDWLCYPLLTIVLVQLMHRRWHRRVLLAALLATACAQATKCLEDHFVGFDETWAHYESIKDELWAKQGVELDSPKVELFERRLKAREASGFLPHSNIAGSYFVLCGIAALALSAARWRRSNDAVGRLLAAGASVGALLICIAAILTKSLGAIVSAAVGILLWGCVILLRSWIDAHRRGITVIGWGLVVLGLFAVVGHGLHHGSLPGSSLNFRWQYWQASSELIGDHVLTGVGRENFGRHYLQYKSIEAAEEIANPHNLFVQAAADWGLIGLIGIAAMLIGASLAVMRSAPTSPPDSVYSADPPSRYTVIGWTAALAVGVVLARLPLLGTTDPNFLYYTSVTVGLAWLIGFACFASGIADVTRRFVSTGAAIGLFTFVLHDMINFGTFVPSTATTLFAMLAFCIAERSPVEQRAAGFGLRGRPRDLKVAARWWKATHKPARRWGLLAALTATTIGVLVVAAIPVGRASHYKEQALTLARYPGFGAFTVRQVDEAFLGAVAADPLDPTACVERARWWLAMSASAELRDEAFQIAAESLAHAVDRDPFSVAHRRMQTQLYQVRARHAGRLDDYLAAIAAARNAVKLYPADPNGYVSLADCQLAAGEATRSADLLRDAVESYDQALAVDDARPEWERIRGFRSRERQAIDARIQQAKSLLHDEP